MTATRHGSRPDETKESQETTGIRQGDPEGIANIVREQTQPRPRTTDSHPAASVQVADAGPHASAEAILGKVQLYDSAREGDRQSQQRQPGERADVTKTYERTENYYGKVTDTNPSEADFRNLWSRSAVVIDASQVKEFQARAERMHLPQPGPHVDAYMSSRGFSTPEQRSEFVGLLSNPAKLKELGVSDKSIQALKSHGTWSEGDVFKKTGSDKTYDAARLDETNPALHEVYKKCLADKVRKLPAGVGLFVDDADMSDLISKRQEARGIDKDGKQVRPENAVEADKYQTAIDNHVDTIHAVVQAARERQGTVVINRGQELTRGDWTAWDRNGRTTKVGDEKGEDKEVAGWKKADDVRRQLSEINGCTTKVMFESVGVKFSHNSNDAANQAEVSNYRQVMRDMMGPNADRQRSIEFTAYVNNNPGAGEDPNSYFTSREKVQDTLTQLCQGMNDNERRWIAEHMVVNTYPHRGLEKSPNENPVTTYRVVFNGNTPQLEEVRGR